MKEAAGSGPNSMLSMKIFSGATTASTNGDPAQAAIGPLTVDVSGMAGRYGSSGLRDFMYGTIVRTSVRGVNVSLRRLNVWEVDPNDP